MHDLEPRLQYRETACWEDHDVAPATPTRPGAGDRVPNAAGGMAPWRRTVFLSDVHLGAPHCHAAELARFLSRLRCQRLYLVGDIVDLWWMAQRRPSWGPAHSEVIQALHALRRAGTEIVYIPGNHDASLRQLCGLMLPAMRVRRRAIHTTADGRRLLVVHGDDYDGVTHFGGLQERFGDWLYYRILTGNRLLNAVRGRLGLRYWSLSAFLKQRSSAAERYIERFVQAGLADVRQRGLDGIVCGHIHRAALVERQGLVYANDGDWVESLTALAEDPDGSLRLIDHHGQTLVHLVGSRAAV